MRAVRRARRGAGAGRSCASWSGGRPVRTRTRACRPDARGDAPRGVRRSDEPRCAAAIVEALSLTAAAPLLLAMALGLRVVVARAGSPRRRGPVRADRASDGRARLAQLRQARIIEAGEGGEAGRPLTAQELRDHLVTLLAAGHETTATGSRGRSSGSARHPRVVERLADRRTPATARRSRRRVLRIRPVLSVAPPVARADFAVAGTTLPAGALLAPCIYLTHRRADVWGDPLAFRPERLPVGEVLHLRVDPVRRRDPAVPRGAPFALMEMDVVLDEAARLGQFDHSRPGRARPPSRRDARRRARGGRVRSVSTLLAIPNVSEGRDAEAIAAIGAAFASTGARLLDVHSDADHHRSVFTLAGGPGELAPALVAGAREAVARIDLREPRGAAPPRRRRSTSRRSSSSTERRGAACAEALLTADLLEGTDPTRVGTDPSRARLPVYLYGLLAGGRTRTSLRRDGLRAALHDSPGLRAARDRRPGRGGARRRPAAARRVQPRFVRRRRSTGAVAALVRESGADGPAGRSRTRDGGRGARAGVDQRRGPPARSRSPCCWRRSGATRRSRRAELVGLAPGAAFAGWPDHVPVRNRRTVEDALGE